VRGRIAFSGLDFKLGIRMLVRYQGLTVIGGVAIAFGVAAGAGVFELVKDVVFPTIPGGGAERIVRIRNADPRTTGTGTRVHDLSRWMRTLRTVEDVGAFRRLDRNLSLGGVGGAGGEAAAPVQVAEISAATFGLAPVRPLLGRPLTAADEAPGAPAVAVLAYGLWRSRFGGDPEVVAGSCRSASPFRGRRTSGPPSG
jgi:hypothetical protein